MKCKHRDVILLGLHLLIVMFFSELASQTRKAFSERGRARGKPRCHVRKSAGEQNGLVAVSKRAID